MRAVRQAAVLRGATLFPQREPAERRILDSPIDSHTFSCDVGA